MNKNVRNVIPLVIFITAFLLIAFFRGIPLSIVIIKSFFTNSLGNSNEFIGARNYLNVLQNEVFWNSLDNSFFLLMYIPVLMILSLIMSLLIYEGIHFSGFYKTIIVFPQIVSTFIIASIFGGIFGLDGAINSLLSMFGMEQIYWLGSRIPAFFVIIVCVIYSMFGWQTLIFTGALSSVDPNIRALTLIDGVGLCIRIRIYSNAIRNTIIYSAVLNVIYGFAGYFPIIFSLTKGGPGYKTTTIDYLIYIRAFKYGKDMSSAYTIAALLLVIVIAFVLILYTIVDKMRGDQ